MASVSVQHRSPGTRRTELALLTLLVALSAALMEPWRAKIELPASPFSSTASGPANDAAPPTTERLAAGFGNMPATFVANQGQFADDVRFVLAGGDRTIFFTPDGLTFALRQGGEQWNVQLTFTGANQVEPVGEAPTGGVVSYFRGSPSEWNTGVPLYSRVVYANLWPGIDLVYSGSFQRMKYDFIVHPGADPSLIQMTYRGANVETTAGGTLAVSTPAGGFEDDVPVSFQDGAAIATAYRIFSSTADGATFGFTTGAYDPARTLVIDPAVFIYATFIGGALNQYATGITVDSAKNVYVTGLAIGSDFPVVAGPDLDWNLKEDAFVLKLNPSGTQIIYAGFIGGEDFDRGKAIAIDSDGNAYVGGDTQSTDTTFPNTDDDNQTTYPGADPTTNGVLGSWDAFVVKVNPSGTALEYVTFIGGSGLDWVEGLALDANRNVYITGLTTSDETEFPDGNGFGGIPGANQVMPNILIIYGYVAKLNPAGTSFVYATYIGGGTGDRNVYDLKVDGTGNAYVVGDTGTGTWLAGLGAPASWDTSFNGTTDAYVAKLNASGSAWLYAGFIGGSSDEMGYRIAVDDNNAAYATGYTGSSQATFPTGTGFGALQGADTTYNGATDSFIAKIAPAGTNLVYASYIGGAGEELYADVAIDSAGNAYIVASTTSPETSFPDGGGIGTRPGPDNTFNGETDAYIVRLNAPGTAFDHAGYIGGAGHERWFADIALDLDGEVYIAGLTESSEASFPDGDGFGNLPGFDQTYGQGAGGAFEAFIVKLGTFDGHDEDPCPGPANINLVVGANGYVYCGDHVNLIGVAFRAPGIVPDAVSAIFWWNSLDQLFHFWFRGFPVGFQTLHQIEDGEHYFFQSTTATDTIPNFGGTWLLDHPGDGNFASAAAGATGVIWSGTDKSLAELDAYTGVSAVFGWSNPNQRFDFWFRGFPEAFQTLSGVDRGNYYFFQTAGGVFFPMD